MYVDEDNVNDDDDDDDENELLIMMCILIIKSCANDDHDYEVEIVMYLYASSLFWVLPIIISLHDNTYTDYLSNIRHDRTYSKLYVKIYNS